MSRENWQETFDAIDDIIQRSPPEGRNLNDIEKEGLAEILQQMLESRPGITLEESGKENDLKMLLSRPLGGGALEGGSYNGTFWGGLTFKQQMVDDQKETRRIMAKPLGQAIRISLVDIEVGGENINRLTMELNVTANNELRLRQVV